MKTLVTGASGMLGSALCPALSKNGHEVYATDLLNENQIDYLDITKAKDVEDRVRRIDPDILIHLAAKTDVDSCELNPRESHEVNTVGTENVVKACRIAEIPLVHVSTIGVFDGEKVEPYIETDVPNPINVYGKTKLEAEKIVSNSVEDYYIVRAGWMMGGGPSKDKKFVGKIIRQVEKNSEIMAVTDKIGSPTYAVDFSECLVNLIRTRHYGLYHCTNKGSASRFDVAQDILQHLRREDVRLIPVDSSRFPLPAKRAPSEVSRNQRLESIGLDSMRPWREALHDYIRTRWSFEYAASFGTPPGQPAY
jgi:dTDP-4-dehydrorhamnose reductase